MSVFRRRVGVRWPWVMTAVVAVVAFVVSMLAALVVAPATKAVAASAPAASAVSSAPLARPVPSVPSGQYATDESPRPVPTPVQELVADRTARSSTWQNSDGSMMVREYADPRFYRPSPSADWTPIDMTLAATAGQAGWWHSVANSWSVSFGPAGASGGSERLSLAGTAVAFSPRGVSDPGQTPTVSGATATYANVWPHTDLVEQVTTAGVGEDLVLNGPGAAASYTFGLSGASAQPNSAGGLDLLVAGTTVATVPAPRVSTAAHARPLSGTVGTLGAALNDTRTSGARLSVTIGGDVQVSVSAQWLAGLPATAFPVVIDPEVEYQPNPTQAIGLDGIKTVRGQMQIGVDSQWDLWRGAVQIAVPQPPAPLPGASPWRLWRANVQGLCSNPDPTGGCPFKDLTAYGEAVGGTPTFDSIPTGQKLYSTVGQLDPGAIGFYATSWFATHGTSWLGFTANETSAAGSMSIVPTSDLHVDFDYVDAPPPTTVQSPEDGSVIATSTPTLTAQVTDTNPDDTVSYDFSLSTAPGGVGTVIDSGWVDQPTWQVPQGALHDGVTYYARVLDASGGSWTDPTADNYNPPAAAGAEIHFQVKKRLGAGGPSPTDTVGSPPGQTSTPSQGAPSPGTAPSSETVDLVTGNLALTVGTHGVQALAGPAEVTLNYNSSQGSTALGANYGLLGQYYSDNGTHTFPTSPAGQRTDPTVNINLGQFAGPVIGGLPVGQSAFLVRWTGELTLPAGTWKLGGLSTGGMRIDLGGSPIYDDWDGHASTTSPSFGSTALTGGTSRQIKVEAWDPGEATQLQLWAKNTAITDPDQPSAFPVQSNWLTPTATGLPAGWSLANTATATWTRATDEGSQVVLDAADGQTATFTVADASTGLYYVAPPGDHDYLSVNGDGQLQLSTTDSYVYVFNADGSLASMTSATDDRHPAALKYEYNGDPAVLTTITDPVSGQAVQLNYGGDVDANGVSLCPTSNAPAGMLCKITTWDDPNAPTLFGYDSVGQLISVDGPGGQSTQFGYDSDNRLADLRDALANDYINAGQPGSSDCSGGGSCPFDTQISYDSTGRVATVTQPAPTPSAARPQRSYTYATGTGTVTVAGQGSSFDTQVSYDNQSRILTSTNAAGQTSVTVWNANDWPLATTDPAGEQTSTVYDTSGNITDTYGPAPTACFATGGWPTGTSTVAAPIQGYLPVADPQNTTGCGLATVPHTHNGYDEATTGLAATYWSNGQLAGAAVKHGPGTVDSDWCDPGDLGENLCMSWPAGPPVDTDPTGNWSLQLTGTLTIPTAGGYGFGLANTEPAKLFVDGTLTVEDDPQLNGQFVAGQVNFESGFLDLSGGPHTIEVDYVGAPGNSNALSVLLQTGGNGQPYNPLPDTMLDPDYGLQTSSTDPDGKTTTTSYSNASIGAWYGLPTATTTGANSDAALTTITAYEAPGETTYLRKTASTLPAGNATSYSYYTTGAPMNTCGVPAGAPQGGLLETQTDPAPASGQPAREQQFLYDSAGRQVGRRVGPSDTLDAAGWQCTSYDARGRITTQTWPAFNGAPARTVTHTYAVNGNPLLSSVTDGTTTITGTVDLLGRLVSYTDAMGQTTTITYNQAGQVIATTGPGGDIRNTYDPATTQLHAVALGASVLATNTYDPTTGRLTQVAYANGTTATLGYDSTGKQNSLVFTNTGTGALVTGNQTTYSPAGRITSELENINGTSLTNANPAGPTASDYSYDGAGRLVDAYLPGAHATYSYATNPTSDNCPSSSNAGANTNRTNITTTPTGGNPTSIDSCYNNADQLVKTITGGTASTDYSYDGHGNQTHDGGTTLSWDAADRLASTTTASGTTTSYTYDALDRVIARTTNGVTTSYCYAGYTDSPAGTCTASGVVQEFVSLPGGVLDTIQPGPAYTPVAPTRVLDTRTGLGAPQARVAPNGVVSLQVTGRGGVPTSGVAAVALTITAVAPTGASGFMRVYPDGTPTPLAVALQYTLGQTISTPVTAQVGANGKIDILNLTGTTDILADVVGYYPITSTGYTPLTPTRILDTRTGNGAPQARVAPGGVISLQVAGRGGVPTSGVAAVEITVTAVAPTGAAGSLGVYPDGASQATADLDYQPGQSISNLVTAQLGANGKIDIANTGGTTDILTDVAGYYPPPAADTPRSPKPTYSTPAPAPADPKAQSHPAPPSPSKPAAKPASPPPASPPSSST